MKQNYVTVTLRIYQLSRHSPGLTHSTVSVYSLRQIQGPICCSRLLHRSFTLLILGSTNLDLVTNFAGIMRPLRPTVVEEGSIVKSVSVCLSVCVFVCP